MLVLLLSLEVYHHVDIFLLVLLNIIQLVLRVKDLLAAIFEVFFTLAHIIFILFVSILLLPIINILFTSFDVDLSIII